MKQNLQFKASQHLSLTPQLQQSIKLLQMSSVELNQELEILIQQNPLIEMIEEEDDEENKNTLPISQEETSFENNFILLGCGIFIFHFLGYPSSCNKII